MLEEKIQKLLEKRKIINNSDSFNEISKIWSLLKKEHKECKEEIKAIISNLDKVTEEPYTDIVLENGFDFDKALKNIKEISEIIKDCSVSKFVDYIKKLTLLKQKCMKYLSIEKAKMEEVE